MRGRAEQSSMAVPLPACFKMSDELPAAIEVTACC